MKLTVLADNNTYIDQYYGGEPAVSYYIEDAGQRNLFSIKGCIRKMADGKWMAPR
jgi:metal-dependent hydrolase (beta-lactamase superfamily II)